MDWERFLQDGVVPLENSLDDSHYHEKSISPSVSPIPAAASSLSASKYQYQSDEEEKELRRMKKGKAKALPLEEERKKYSLAEEMELSKFWIKPGPFPYPFYYIHQQQQQIPERQPSTHSSQNHLAEPSSNDNDAKLIEWFDQQLLQKMPQVAFDGVRTNLVSIICRDEPIESELMDLIGLEHWDFLESIVAKRDALRSAFARSKGKGSGQKGGFTIPSEINYSNRKGMVKKSDLKVIKNSVAVGPNPNNYPHIYNFERTSISTPFPGQKLSLPANTERKDTGDYELYTIPFTEGNGKYHVQLRGIRDNFPEHLWPCFKGYENLNRMQSLVYPVAYGTNNNLLVCAPTGAGKTDVALMTVLKTFELHGKSAKIVYIAPMKALASEVTRKFRKKLASLNLIVEEWTGDVSLTIKEINDTFMFVTTPEKWDVVTRRPLEQLDFVQMVRAIIIDEVHLLQDERGSVLESIVARTFRQMEMTQQIVRMIGLSATLPNYTDVASFLRVNPHVGLFYFDSSFRPVPLTQKIFGVKGRSRTLAYRNMNKVSFEQCMEYIKDGYQVMVFVHSRNDTNKTARAFLDLMHEYPDAKEYFDIEPLTQIEGYSSFQQTLQRQCRNKQVKELFKHGFTIHHAGILRGDRNLVEEMFEKGYARVLFCTSTLAWGVNLPAHAVIIRGTELYDPSIGAYTQLSILDILQIFGRAGRPQYEDHGVGILLTPHNQLHSYLRKLALAAPIESQFMKWDRIVMNLNAEISAANIENMSDAMSWVSYTFAHVRMCKNPLVYGIGVTGADVDGGGGETTRGSSHLPFVNDHVRGLLERAAGLLASCGMISYDPKRSDLVRVREPGRVASQFYLHHETIELFLKAIEGNDRDGINCEADVFMLLSKCKEWETIQLRESEMKQLTFWFADYCMLDRTSGDAIAFDEEKNISQVWQKVLILVQTILSSHCNPTLKTEEFSLISDMNYVSSNVGRISAGLLALSIFSGKSQVYEICLSVDKSLRNCAWSNLHPLNQFAWRPKKSFSKVNVSGWDFDSKNYPSSLINASCLEEDYKSPKQLSLMTPEAIATYFQTTPHIARNVKKVSRHFPDFSLSLASVSFVSETWVKLVVKITSSPAFDWNPDDKEKIGGIASGRETGRILIFDGTGRICQSKRFNLSPRKRSDSFEFLINVFDDGGGGDGDDLWMKWVSDKWLQCEADAAIQVRLDLAPNYDWRFERVISKQIHELEPVQDPITGDLMETITSQAYFVATHPELSLYFQSGPGPWKDELIDHAIRAYFSQRQGAVKKTGVLYVCGQATVTVERLAHVFGRDVVGPEIAVIGPDEIGNLEDSFAANIKLLILDDLTQLSGILMSKLTSIAAKKWERDGVKIVATSPVPIFDLLQHLEDLETRMMGKRFIAFQFGWKIRSRPLQVYLETFMNVDSGASGGSSSSGGGGYDAIAGAGSGSGGGLGGDIVRSIYRHISTQQQTAQSTLPPPSIVLWTVSKKKSFSFAQSLISLSSLNGFTFLSRERMRDPGVSLEQDILPSITDPLLRHVMGFGIVMVHGDLSDSDLEIACSLYQDQVMRVMIIVNCDNADNSENSENTAKRLHSDRLQRRLNGLHADIIVIQDTKRQVRRKTSNESFLLEMELCDLMGLIDIFCPDHAGDGAGSLIKVVLCCDSHCSGYYRTVLQTESFQRLKLFK